MATMYCVSFITGFEKVVEESLKKDIPSYELVSTSEGVCIFKGNCNYAKVASLPYVNNVFLVISYYPKPEFGLMKLVKALLEDADFFELREEIPFKSFRLMAQKGSELIRMPSQIMGSLKEKIARITGANWEPLKADAEFLIMMRTNGQVIFGVKQTRSKEVQYGGKGELRPALTSLLIRLSHPTKNDIFIDPFAGSGAIAAARQAWGPAKKIYASDKDKGAVTGLHKRFKGQPTIAQKYDAMHLEFFEKETVTRIVTDPPWGFFDNLDTDFVYFYGEMLIEFNRILAKEGESVILTARTYEFEEALKEVNGRLQELERPQLVLTDQLHTLVNGKKATAYALKKTA